MKKLMIATMVIVTIASYAVWVWAANRTAPELAAQKAVTPVKQERVMTKYDIGPPDTDELLEMVNAERAKVGVAPLVMDENVRMSAQLKSDDFVERDYYSHTIKGYDKGTLTAEMAYYVNQSCSSSSENINAGVYSTQSAMAKWLASEPHRKAILDAKYTSTGYGISKDKNGEYYVVQHFCVAN